MPNTDWLELQFSVSGFQFRVLSAPETATSTLEAFFHGTSCLCSSKYFLLRSAQRKVNSIEARVRARLAGYSVHSSNAMMMSAPHPICASMALSGLEKCGEPSRCERERH